MNTEKTSFNLKTEKTPSSFKTEKSRPTSNLKITIGLKTKTVTYKSDDMPNERNNEGLDLNFKQVFENVKVKDAQWKKRNAIENSTGRKSLAAKKDKKDKKDEEEEDEMTVLEASKHIFSCLYCKFAATDPFELKSHYNSHHPNDILTCQPCNQYFLSLKVS